MCPCGRTGRELATEKPKKTAKARKVPLKLSTRRAERVIGGLSRRALPRPYLVYSRGFAVTEMSPGVQTIGPIEPAVQVSGSDLEGGSACGVVEDGDVAFALALCREVHRLYDGYRRGELEPSAEAAAGLEAARTMLDSLLPAIASGMPSMRLEVARAEAEEMLVVLLGGRMRPPGDAAVGPEATVVAEGADAAPAATDRPAGRRRVGRRLLEFSLGLGACAVVGALIDVPIVVMALFPSHLSEIAGGYGLLVAAGAGRRIGRSWIRSRRGGPAPGYCSPRR